MSDIVERLEGSASLSEKIAASLTYSTSSKLERDEAIEWRASATKDREAAAEITKLRDALRDLVDALDRCKPGIDSAFSMAWVHGQRYDGPTYEKELEAARTALGEE